MPLIPEDSSLHSIIFRHGYVSFRISNINWAILRCCPMLTVFFFCSLVHKTGNIFIFVFAIRLNMAFLATVRARRFFLLAVLRYVPISLPLTVLLNSKEQYTLDANILLPEHIQWFLMQELLVVLYYTQLISDGVTSERQENICSMKRHVTPVEGRLNLFVVQIDYFCCYKIVYCILFLRNRINFCI